LTEITTGAALEPLDERCPQCGRALTIIKVVYNDEEGEGTSVGYEM
jgi:hypothetical protein